MVLHTRRLAAAMLLLAMLMATIISNAHAECANPEEWDLGSGCVPKPAGGPCAYSNLKVNPWELWNIFSLGDATLAEVYVEGRVAVQGKFNAKRATLHYVEEPFINTKKVPSFAVSATDTIWLLNTEVTFGGVESKMGVDKDNSFVTSGVEDRNKASLSVDVAAAATYFAGRSAAFTSLPASQFPANVTTNEIRIRVTGKVNVVSGITTAQLATVKAIILEGHPLGVAIINVVGKNAAFRDLVTAYVNRQGGIEQLTFGRVLLNFVDAETLNINDPAVSPATEYNLPQGDPWMSVLAPNAQLKMVYGNLRGNLIVGGIVEVEGRAREAVYFLQPFGTPTRRLVPTTPKPRGSWTAAGRSATQCLWNVL